jgi:hypothetical protein
LLSAAGYSPSPPCVLDSWKTPEQKKKKQKHFNQIKIIIKITTLLHTFIRHGKLLMTVYKCVQHRCSIKSFWHSHASQYTCIT